MRKHQTRFYINPKQYLIIQPKIKHKRKLTRECDDFANFEKCENCEHFQNALQTEKQQLVKSKERRNEDNFFVRPCPEIDFLFIDLFQNLKKEQQKKIKSISEQGWT